MGQAWDTAFGAARPEDCIGLYSRRHLSSRRKGAGLVLPSCNSEAMALHLEESREPSPQMLTPSFSSIMPDGHVSAKLPVPDNITLLPLPAKSPELNPVENIWQFMRDNWLSNCVFEAYDDILDHCCFAWNKLIGMPFRERERKWLGNGR
jgi:hypothetical protein